MILICSSNLIVIYLNWIVSLAITIGWDSGDVGGIEGAEVLAGTWLVAAVRVCIGDAAVGEIANSLHLSSVTVSEYLMLLCDPR